jgi:hypothetical protein
MSDSPRSTLELKVARFVQLYGVDQLINYLDEFDYMVDPVRYKKFRKVVKFTCDAFGITIADMNVISNTQTTDAKRIVSYIAHHNIGFRHNVIAGLLHKVSIRSVSNYIKHAEDWINNPKANKSFYEAYIIVTEKFNNVDNAKD